MRLAHALDHDRRPVAQDFRHAVHHFGRVVPDADHRVGVELPAVPRYYSLLPGLNSRD